MGKNLRVRSFLYFTSCSWPTLRATAFEALLLGSSCWRASRRHHQAWVTRGYRNELDDIRYLFVRALQKLVRNPILIFFSLSNRLSFSCCSRNCSTRSIRSPGFPKGVSYVQYAVTVILLQNAFRSDLQGGTSIMDDLNYGFLQKMLVTHVRSRPTFFCSAGFRVMPSG